MEFENVLRIENLKVKLNKLKSIEFLFKLKIMTNFLPDSANISERVYCIDNELLNRPYCYCGNETKYISYTKGYTIRCSRKCMYNDELVKEKRKRTNIEKYGVSSFTKTKEYIEKTKKTNIEKYGVEFYLNSKDKIEKTIKYNMEKYGVDHHMKSTEFMSAFKQMNIDKFGVDNVSKLDTVKEKKKLTFQNNYGLDHIFCDIELMRLKMLEKYGVEHNSKMESTIKKMKETGVRNGNYVSDELKKDYEVFRNKVDKLTKKSKLILINNWNGYDYYDGEYIRDNYQYDYNNDNYPTIDHKISVQYGFMNNIDPSVIASETNLCITKRSINISKNKLTEFQFKALFP